MKDGPPFHQTGDPDGHFFALAFVRGRYVSPSGSANWPAFLRTVEYGLLRAADAERVPTERHTTLTMATPDNEEIWETVVELTPDSNGDADLE